MSSAPGSPGASESYYEVEYAKSGRASCKGPKTCTDKNIEKGDLRFGSHTSSGQFGPTVYWRHWKCVTTKILDKIADISEVRGLSNLNADDQQKVRAAVETKTNPDYDAYHAAGAAKLAAAATGEVGSDGEKKVYPSKKLQKEAEKEEKKRAKEAAKAEKDAAKAEKDAAKAKAKAENEEAKAAKEEAKAAKAAAKRKKAEDAEGSPKKKAKRAPKKKAASEEEDEEDQLADEQ